LIFVLGCIERSGEISMHIGRDLKQSGKRLAGKT
jgi:hypothetical protein